MFVVVRGEKEGHELKKNTAKMKAAVIRQFGDIGVLKVESIERPEPKPGEILIKVLAAGVQLDFELQKKKETHSLQSPL